MKELTSETKKVFYTCPHTLFAVGHHVGIVQLLMTIMKSANYVILVNYIEDMQHKLKDVIHVLKRFVTLTLEDICAPIVTMTNVISGRILTPV